MADRIDRRAFLRNASLIAAGVVAADHLDLLERMTWTRRLWPGWSRPALWGDGIHNDSPGLQALIDGREVYHHGLRRAVRGQSLSIPHGTYRSTETLHIRGNARIDCNGSTIICTAIAIDPEAVEAAERAGVFHMPLRNFVVTRDAPVVFRSPPVLTLLK